MDDYTRFDFTIRSAEDLIRMVTEAKAHGIEPTITINGYQYGIDFGKGERA